MTMVQIVLCNGHENFDWIDGMDYLRKTKGIPPRIAFFPSKDASLLERENLLFSWLDAFFFEYF